MRDKKDTIGENAYLAVEQEYKAIGLIALMKNGVTVIVETECSFLLTR